MYSVTDARTEATNSKCITRESGDICTHTVNRSAKFNDNTQHCDKVCKPKWLLKVHINVESQLISTQIVLQNKVVINYLRIVIFCTSHKDVSSVFSLADCALENQSST